MQQSEFGREVPCFEVEATTMEPTFDRLYSYLFGLPPDASADNDPNKALPTAIFILNLDKVCPQARKLIARRVLLNGNFVAAVLMAQKCAG